MICPADKGGGLIVMSKAFYREEMDRLLADRSTYQVLTNDPVFEYKTELQVLIQQGKNSGVLNKKECLYLDPSACRRPIIYFLLRVHKNAQNPSGRPIVNSIDSVTARLGQYIDYFLKPLVSTTTAYLKDTKHAIHILNQHLPATTVFWSRQMLAHCTP